MEVSTLDFVLVPLAVSLVSGFATWDKFDDNCTWHVINLDNWWVSGPGEPETKENYVVDQEISLNV